MDDWYRLRKITPEKLALARQVLEEVRHGADAYRALPFLTLSTAVFILS